jgi:hypothetical protein
VGGHSRPPVFELEVFGVKMPTVSYPIVALQAFVAATRDTGYKSSGAAIAELVDNALEARATDIDVVLDERLVNEGVRDVIVRVTDNGDGMEPDVLRLALQFGGSTRFGSRAATGRYGMGLPNGGLSQGRRIDVYTWTKPGAVWSSYLDVDEICHGKMRVIPIPQRVLGTQFLPRTASGTSVILSKCDRLDHKSVPMMEKKLLAELGRIFRKSLYSGKRILVNGTNVRPVDPLFLNSGVNVTGAVLYGPPLEYSVRVPPALKWHSPVSTVSVRFSELPLEQWHEFSNEKKNELGIAKNAGVSIIRAGREIDYGWYFMGTKRKENYDDWWRCEVSFSPELDELFGVTHSKQKINPSELISTILTQEMERIARELNSRVRRKYAQIRSSSTLHTQVLRRLETRDYLLEPPKQKGGRSRQKHVMTEPKFLRKRNDGLYGLRFSLSHATTESNTFYTAGLDDGNLSVTLNEGHPFYSGAYVPLANGGGRRSPLQCVLLLLMACARADCMLKRPKEREIMRRFRDIWSDTVAAFLS